MLKIGDFSKLSMISVRMLRHYDENGLLGSRSRSTASAGTATIPRNSSGWR